MEKSKKTGKIPVFSILKEWLKINIEISFIGYYREFS